MIYLHLGAHKTATTYLQDLLALNQGRIADAGRAYWRVEHIRPLVAHAIWANGRKQGGISGWLRRKALRGVPFADLERTLAAHERVILSDENIPGEAFGALGGNIYPRAEQRLRHLRKAMGDRPSEVWLCLRAYPTFLASLYAEALRHGAYLPIAEFVARNAAPGGQWPALVDAIHRALPDSPIAVWRYEDFRTLEPAIVERLTGLPPSALHPLPAGEVRPSPSARAVAVHCERAGELAPLQRILAMAAAEDAFPPEGRADRFDPWNAQQAALMNTAYERDLSEVGSKPFVEFLTP